MRWNATLSITAIAMWLLLVAAGATGELKLDVMGDLGAGAKNQAEVVASDGKVVATITPGATIALPPGVYKLKLPLVGG
ncbi:MAG TPA: hypothetical protein VKR29_09910, partial [Candidatus Binataceae bacterium]|nr:hypothetical protein [Candidatus Binataceae bacterium]